MTRPFLIAVQFLTRVPVPLRRPPSEQEIGRSLAFYPLVGLLLGVVLAGCAWLGSDLDAMLRAALLLSLWVLVTGALHLDGLADSADAWAGGAGDSARTREIMKDPCCGPVGTVFVVLVLVLKFAALAQFDGQADLAALMVIPMLARASVTLLFITTPYVSPEGLGTALATAHSRIANLGTIALAVLLTAITAGTAGFWLLLGAVIVLAAARMLMCARLGGTTGDTAGALIEITEAITLTIVAARLS